VTTTNPPDASYEDHEELRKKLLEINVWAMLLVIALVLERASDSIVFIVGTTRHVDTKVWAAMFIMLLVLAALLATTVGILVLHVRFRAPYNYWYVILDNVFLTVPLYLAVRFVASSTLVTANSTTSAALFLDDRQFRIGVGLIALSYVFLFVRDLIVFPKIRDKIQTLPLAAFGALHFLGAMLFLSAAIAPNSVVYVVVIGTVGFAFFFTGMVATPIIERRYAVAPVVPVAPGPVVGGPTV
jgi:hypothetical protein